MQNARLDEAQAGIKISGRAKTAFKSLLLVWLLTKQLLWGLLSCFKQSPGGSNKASHCWFLAKHLTQMTIMSTPVAGIPRRNAVAIIVNKRV